MNPFSEWEKQKKRIVLRTIEKSRSDLIHFHFAGTAIQWSWIADALQVPFTFSMRGSMVQVAPYTIESHKEKLKATGEKAAGIHAVCEALKQEFCVLVSL